MEITKGLYKQNRSEALLSFQKALQSAEVLSFERASAEIAGHIQSDLERAGLPIGRADAIIAAIVLQNDLELVTGNTRHYQRIHELGYGLRLDNWRE